MQRARERKNKWEKRQITLTTSISLSDVGMHACISPISCPTSSMLLHVMTSDVTDVPRSQTHLSRASLPAIEIGKTASVNPISRRAHPQITLNHSSTSLRDQGVIQGYGWCSISWPRCYLILLNLLSVDRLALPAHVVH